MEIELRNVSIGYASHVVAADLSASLHAGELTCILGSNGAGKSTLLRTLCGFQPALSGDICLVDGDDVRDISAITPKEKAKVISVVLTERADLQNMKVRELVGMGRAPYTDFWGRLRDDDARIVDEALQMIGISALSERMMQTLSDGERQKVMIAKALAQQTPVILLDEPTAFLDYPSKVELMQLLRKLCREMGKIVLLSTHDVEIALQLADNLWLMKQGELCVGSPRQLADRGDIVSFLNREDVVFCPEDLTIRVI